jgi:hypothetical protein
VTSHDEEDDEVVVETVVQDMGSVSVAGNSDQLADLLLELVSAVVKLNVLLIEAPEDEFKIVRGRLVFFRRMVEDLPTRPSPKQAMGFKPPAGKKKRK